MRFQKKSNNLGLIRHDQTKVSSGSSLPLVGDVWTALSGRKYTQPFSMASSNGKTGHADFRPPEARRDLLSPQSKDAVYSRRIEEFERMADVGHSVSISTAQPQFLDAASPTVTLAIAQGMLDAPKAIPPIGGAVDSSGEVTQPIPRRAGLGKGRIISSEEALANVAGDYPVPSVDDLFSLKLRGEYGTSKANLRNNGIFGDRFLVLGGEKKFDFAGMDQMKLKVDGVITTGGHWNYPSMEQDLSGLALNVGPEIKFPELPIKLNLNLGAGWLKRKATLSEDGIKNSRADINSFVYGGGAAIHGDWQWRMFKITGLAGVQYATAADKEHTYKDPISGAEIIGKRIEKQTRSAWELPLQLRIGGEYKLLNALSVIPSLWGGYTFNIAGENGVFRNGHIAGAESTWRRHGLTWNRNSYHLGGELRVRAVDRFDLWFAYQKEWVGDDTGNYTGGGVQIAF